jgi:hypothetical protein
MKMSTLLRLSVMHPGSCGVFCGEFGSVEEELIFHPTVLS